MSGFLDESEAAYWRSQWHLAPGVTYLNHGSFGPPPQAVRAARRAWQEQMDAQPMEFFFRQLEPAWFQSRQRLAGLLGAEERNLVFAENATAAMNVLAHSLRLGPGDEVLLTDHEYGAVQRIWRHAVESAAGAVLATASLPLPIEAADQVVEAIFAAVTERTRLLVVSHITSPTAVTLPVEPIVAEAKRRGILVCIDGPHAVAQLPLELERLGCDFYCASCHKWLSAPFGSGFLYVAPQHHGLIRTPLTSWGRLPPGRLETWSDEFIWYGTRDFSPYLTIPAAIDFLEQVGFDRFRRHTHALAQYARQRLVELTGQTPILPDSPDWYGCMAHVPLPPGDAAALQRQLWADERIEVPIVAWKDRRWIRVSCHLYNTCHEIDRLVEAVDKRMKDEG
ncbi:MAG: aminotransferase class V-fold PLP-dependent enzyme [Candidatus Anammoximicrobium sp.]|nr:aminotransferase class V-fold PLP-dependent enzyme [Candidatus Anammoximicrobium sp.]